MEKKSHISADLSEMEGHSSVVGCGHHPRNQITEGMTNEGRNKARHRTASGINACGTVSSVLPQVWEQGVVCAAAVLHEDGFWVSWLFTRPCVAEKSSKSSSKKRSLLPHPFAGSSVRPRRRRQRSANNRISSRMTMAVTLLMSGRFLGAANIGPLLGKVRAQLFAGDGTVCCALYFWTTRGGNSSNSASPLAHER